MRYYKFNRNRSLDPLQKYRKSCRKLGYLAKRNNLRMLDSFNFENQTWGALHKAWKGYVIAKNKDELSRMKYYAIVIQKLEHELGIKLSDFPEIDLLALQFFREHRDQLPDEMTADEILNILSPHVEGFGCFAYLAFSRKHDNKQIIIAKVLITISIISSRYS